MTRRFGRAVAGAAALVIATLLASRAQAAGYTMTWTSVAGGGVTYATAGGYRLGGSIGQSDAGIRNGGGYHLTDGFFGAHPARLSAVTPAASRLTPYRLAAPTPNPFHDATELAFALPAPASVQLDVFDVGGQRVLTLASGHFGAGDVRVRWDGSGSGGGRARAGLYFVRLDVDGRRTVQRVVMLP